MILYSILLVICIIFVAILSNPIRIRYESPMSCYIYWIFIKIRIKMRQGALKTDVKLFNRKSRLFSSKKKKQAQDKQDKKQKPGKSKRSFSLSMAMQILQDKAAKKAGSLLLGFLIRAIKAVKITLLNWDIGLKDYYRQGILCGILHSLPQSENFQITGNFSESNKLRLKIRISLWRLVFAVLILIVRFPYIRTYLLYRKVSVQGG